MSESKKSGKKPVIKANEIEITPAMIKAGKMALLDFNRDYESAEDGAVRIFLEMIAVMDR